MINRKHISNLFGVTEQYLSMLLNNKRSVSWPLAERLSELFPCRTIQQWKKAKPEELKRAFAQLGSKEVA